MISSFTQHVQQLKQSHFIKSVLTVAAGIVSTQAIALAFTPVLTRQYGPEAFGAVAAFSAVVNIFTPFASLGFANAIVMPKDEEGATAVARLAVISAASVAPIAAAIVWIFKAHLAGWTGLETRPDFLYLIPVSLALTALLSIANQTAVREGLFRDKASSSVRSALVANLGKVLAGLFAPTGLVLIGFTIAGNALNLVMLLLRVPRRGAFALRRWIGLAGVRQAAREHRDFAFYQMPQSVINSVSFGLPVIVLTSYYGAAIAGQYSMTTLVLAVPVMLLGQSVVEVLYPKMTRSIQADRRTAFALLRRATLIMALLALVPFGIVALAGDRLIPFALGEQWAKAGQYSRWIALWMMCALASRPSVAAIPALRMQRTLLIYEIVVTLARLSALYFGRAAGNDVQVVRQFSQVNIAGYLTLIGIVILKSAWIRKEGDDRA